MLYINSNFFQILITKSYNKHIIYHTKEKQERTKENLRIKHIYERGEMLCQKIEDAVDSDLVMIVAV